MCYNNSQEVAHSKIITKNTGDMPKVVLSNELSEEVEPMSYAYNMLKF